MNSRNETSLHRKWTTIRPVAPLFLWVGVCMIGLITAVFTVYLLDTNPVYALQSLWLVSRASAIAAYLILTLIVLTGQVLSHPRNKDKWRKSKWFMPWHQALVPMVLTLLFVHLLFTILDAKSGVYLFNLILPLEAHYRPIAMLFGVVALYILLLVTITALFPGLFRRSWLKFHRVALVIWGMVWMHGYFGGTDQTMLSDLYFITGAIVFGVFFWRHWVQSKPLKPSKIGK